MKSKENVMEWWVCGQLRVVMPDGICAWDFQGIWDSRCKAVKACKNASHFIFPVKPNTELPSGPVMPPGLEYPKLETITILQKEDAT